MPMSDRKMSGKQPITGGFDLNAFVSAAEPAVEVAPAAPKSPPKPVSAPERMKPLVEAKKAVKSKSKPPKPKKENLSVRVQVRITQTEFEKLEQDAGLVPHSAFLRKFLQDKGLL